MKKQTKLAVTIICSIFVCWFICRIVLFSIFIFTSVQSDVAKRIQSPDKTKVALLIRRRAFIDLNFVVKVKEDRSFKTIHFSGDFPPDLSADWNEKLIWSDDSSFLVMMVDDITNENEKYMWAYDFENNGEYTDNSLILETLELRNNKTENTDEFEE